MPWDEYWYISLILRWVNKNFLFLKEKKSIYSWKSKIPLLAYYVIYHCTSSCSLTLCWCLRCGSWNRDFEQKNRNKRGDFHGFFLWIFSGIDADYLILSCFTLCEYHNELWPLDCILTPRRNRNQYDYRRMEARRWGTRREEKCILTQITCHSLNCNEYRCSCSRSITYCHYRCYLVSCIDDWYDYFCYFIYRTRFWKKILTSYWFTIWDYRRTHTRRNRDQYSYRTYLLGSKKGTHKRYAFFYFLGLEENRILQVSNPAFLQEYVFIFCKPLRSLPSRYSDQA